MQERVTIILCRSILMPTEPSPFHKALRRKPPVNSVCSIFISWQHWGLDAGVSSMLVKCSVTEFQPQAQFYFNFSCNSTRREREAKRLRVEIFINLPHWMQDLQFIHVQYLTLHYPSWFFCNAKSRVLLKSNLLFSSSTNHNFCCWIWKYISFCLHSCDSCFW